MSGTEEEKPNDEETYQILSLPEEDSNPEAS